MTLLEKLKNLAAHGPVFEPVSLGPKWQFDTPDRLTVTAGPLAGTTFQLRTDIGPRKADFYLDRDASDPDSRLVAHVHFERDPDTGLETEWDIFIHPAYRGKSLSSLMVRLSFRRLLAEGSRHWFAVRKLMQVDSRRRELHNLGIGVISLRVGMRPEPALEEILAPTNVKSIQIIEGGPDGPDKSNGAGPPGLFIELRRLPGVVVAAELDPDTDRFYADPEHYRRLISPAELARAARAGQAIIGNIDYVLVPENIELFCRHFADTPAEYRAWLRALRSGARRQGV